MGAPNRPSLAGGEAEKVGEEAVLNRAPGRKGGAGEERREKISLGRCVVYVYEILRPPSNVRYSVWGIGCRKEKKSGRKAISFFRE